MAPTAPLNYTSQTGYYGLRVNETLESVIGSVRKPLRIPLPDRRAKWYALSPYRDYINNVAERNYDRERALLDYRSSGAQLNEAAAQVVPSTAGDDPVWGRIYAATERLESEEAHKLAEEAMKTEQGQETKDLRRENLGLNYGVDLRHSVLAATEDELKEAGVPHEVPPPRPPAPFHSWPAPPPQLEAKGHPQAKEFPTFESLSMGQPTDFRAGKLTISENMSYERAREMATGHTWSS